ncbi:MAG: anhydro-N-acetylmuramic acid kinase [Bacteroidetes bacterium]|nr:anhydro-N-acetylmuramic acid kinase [Bacteroidota bacterium]
MATLQPNSYCVLGLMSGSSLDGLDIAFVDLRETDGHWHYEWIAVECISYPTEWRQKLQSIQHESVPDFLRTHVAYGHYIGKTVRDFLKRYSGEKRPDFITSHGHTILHEPQQGVSCQIGDGASIAAETGLPVISDLRNMDMALGGQGAPIVPIGDKLLFKEYDFLLNLGGIANVTVQKEALAFDICPCNQLLNHFAQQLGFDFDDSGNFAKSGRASIELLGVLRKKKYYKRLPPKSLNNEFSILEIIPLIEAENLSPQDALATCSAHISECIAAAIAPYAYRTRPSKMLASGGGAFNKFLLAQIQEQLSEKGIELLVPDARLISFKEALVMALIGALRWRGERNVLSSVTGAQRDSIGGAIWAGQTQ